MIIKMATFKAIIREKYKMFKNGWKLANIILVQNIYVFM
jgi:hypothetical protein